MGYDYDLAIVGAGSAGLLAAKLASEMGVKAVVVEAERIGGDCLWTGCVPSKALIASARAAHAVRRAQDFGLGGASSGFDTTGVLPRIKKVQESIASTDDSPEALAEMGVDLLRGRATFTGANRLAVADREIRVKFALICTGSRASLPNIPGLSDGAYLTSETVWDMGRLPASMIILGGGPIGTELSQAMSRLGVETTLLERSDRILGRDERSLTKILEGRLQEEGVDLNLNVSVEQAQTTADGIRLTAGEKTWTAERVLVAAGRTPNIDDLGLETVEVKTNRKGIAVSEKLRTSADWIYAAGDCAGRYLFTHSAAAEAGVALRNMFYPGSSSAYEPVPWTTFSDPELAHVGMTSREARKKLGKRNVRVYEWQLDHSDRARADGDTTGRIVVVADKKGRIVGAHILAPAAGEMIGQFTIAIREGLKLTPDLTSVIQVYPTYATAIQQVASLRIYDDLKKPLFKAARRIQGLLNR